MQELVRPTGRANVAMTPIDLTVYCVVAFLFGEIRENELND